MDNYKQVKEKYLQLYSGIKANAARQQTVSQSSAKADWYSGDQPTSMEIRKAIGEVSSKNKAKGNELYDRWKREQSDPNSQYYYAYSQPTNQAVSNLAALGFDTSVLNADWYAANKGWVLNNLEYRSGTGNAPSSPTSKSSLENRVAYELYQWNLAEDKTQEAEKQWADLSNEITFQAQWADKNYSDEEIKNKIDWNKYPLLKEMKDNPKPEKATEYNRVIGYSEDAVDGVIWAARNNGGTGNKEVDTIMYAMGAGNMYQENPEISAKLEPLNPDDSVNADYHPYSVGSTIAYDDAKFFGIYGADDEWLEQNLRLKYYGTEEEQKHYNNIETSVNNQHATDAAEQAVYDYVGYLMDTCDKPEDVIDKLDTALSVGKLYIKTDKNGNVKYSTKSRNGYKEIDLGILNDIDASVGKYVGTDRQIDPSGKLVPLSVGTNYKYDTLVNQIGEMWTANSQKSTDAETVNSLADDLNPAVHEPVTVPETKSPDKQEKIDAVTGADKSAGKAKALSGTTKPATFTEVRTPTDLAPANYTKAEIEQQKTQNKKIREAADVVGDIATDNESTVMKNAGSVAFYGNKQRFDWIRKDAVGNQRFADGLMNISSKNLINEGLDKAHSIAEYANVEANYSYDQAQYDEFHNKYGDLEYLQKEFNPRITITLEGADGDPYDVTLEFVDMNKGYRITDVFNKNYVFGESESGNDLSVYQQAETIAKEQSAEARKILYAQKNVHDNYGEEGEKEVEEYKNLSARLHNEEEYLANNREAYEQNNEALKKSIEKMEMQYDAMMKQGLDASGIREAYDFMTDMLNYHDEPQLPVMNMTKLEYINTIEQAYGKSFTTEEKSAMLHNGIDQINEQIDRINADKAYMEKTGATVPDSYLRNMEYKLADLEAAKKAYEYSAILTDTDPEELEKTVAEGRAFEEKYGDSMQMWQGLFGNDEENPEYYFTLGKKTTSVTNDDGIDYKFITDEDRLVYYYLLGKKVQELGSDNLDELLNDTSFNGGLYQSKDLVTEILKDADDFVEFMNNKDYGIWTTKRAENQEKWAKDNAGVATNIASTLITPIESLVNAGYAFDRALTGSRINPNAPAMLASIFKESTREQTRQNIDEYFKDNPTMKYIADLGYEIYCNRGDSLMNSLFFGALIPEGGSAILNEFAGAAPMGISAAMNAASEAVENGASTEQAWFIFGTTFLAETATEAVTYSNIREAFGVGEELTKESLKQFAMDWLTKSGLEELVGETTNDVVENWADRMATEWFDNPNYESEHQKRIDYYYAQGFTEEGEAEAKALEEEMKGYLHTAFVSYLSAGTDVAIKAGKAAVNTARTAAGVVNDYRSYTKARQKLGYSESMFDYMKQDARDAIANRNQTQEASGQEAGVAAPSETVEATPEQKQAAADVVALGRVEGSSQTAQTEMVASVLDDGEGDAVVSDQANAAATFMPTVLGKDSNFIMQQVITGASNAGVSLDTVKASMRNAALGDGSATSVVQSEEFRNATPEVKAQMLAETLLQDQNNPQVQQNIAAKVNDFRNGMVINGLAAQGHFNQANEAKKKAEVAAKETYDAKKELDARSQSAQAANEAAVEANNRVVQENASDDSLHAQDAALAKVNSTEEVEKQAKQHLANKQQAQQEAEATTQKATEDAMASARETANQTVAQENQQREADALAKAEAERQQKIADQRSGKTAEDSARAKIQRYVEAKGYTGEQAEQVVNDLMGAWQDAQVNKIDLSKQFNKSEGYLMMGALSRRFGVNVDITDITTGENGYYSPNTNTITLNKNLPAGQVLVEFALHELTHSLESTGSYQQYHDTVLNTLFPSEAELNDAIAKKMTDYEEKGHPIDETQAKRELVAEFTRLKLNDKDMVHRMVDAGMGGRIRNALHNVNQFLKNIKLTGEARTEAENLRRTERMFQKAIRERARAQQNANETATVENNGAETNQQGNNAKTRKPFVRASENVSGDTKLIKLPDGSVKSYNNTANDIARDVNKTYKTNISNSSISSEIQKARNLFIHGDAEGAVNAVFELAKNVESAIGLSRNSLKPSALAESLNNYFGNKYIPISESDSNALVSVYGSIAKANRVLVDAGVKARLRLDKNNSNTGLRLDDVFRNNDHVTAEGHGFDVSQALGGVDTARWEDILYELEHQRETYVNQVRDEYTNGGSVSAEDLQAEIHAMLWNQVANYSDVSVDENNKIQINGNNEFSNTETETDWGIDEDDRAFSAVESDLTDAQKAQALQEAGVDYESAVARGDMEAAQEDVDFYAELNGYTYRGLMSDENKEYLSVVDLGRYDLAEKMVDRAAKEAGYIIKAYHGTPNGKFNSFEKSKVGTSTDFGKLGRGFYFTDKKQVADYYAGYLNSSTVMPVYLKLTNPLVLDHNYDNMTVRELYDSILGEGGPVDEQRSEELTEWLVDNGYDGIVADGEYMVLNPENIKSAETVTYDKYGDVIPLSERFRTDHEESWKNRDIRYSAGNAQMTDAQKLQALREANVDYENAIANGDMEAAQEDVDFAAEQHGFTTEDAFHGTLEQNFTEFDFDISDNEIFVSYTKSLSQSYVPNNEDVRQIKDIKRDNQGALITKLKHMTPEEQISYITDDLAEQFAENGFSITDSRINSDGKAEILVTVGDESEWTTIDNQAIYGIAELIYPEAQKNGAGLYRFYTRPGNQLVIEANGAQWNAIPFDEIDPEKGTATTREIADWAKANGYDSVRINDCLDWGGHGPEENARGDVGIFFNKEDVRSADPVTYDDKGNVIPLDQRFSENPDFRYSVGNNQMTDAERNQALIDAGLMTQEELMAQENLPGYPSEGGEAQRQFGYETAQESNALHDEVKQYLYTHSNYMPDTNQGQVNRAIGWVQSKATESDPDGYYAALDEIASDTFDYRSADGQARMLTVMSMAALKAEHGRTAEERRNALNDELRIADAYNKQGTDLGRALQARKIFRLMTPLGRVAALQSMADRINEDYGKKGIKNRVGLSEWTLKAASEAQTEEDFQKVQDAAAKELADQMPVSWKERLNALRMLSMLGNPRTHIRNIIGNALFVPAVSLKNKLGAVMELGMDKGDRTKTLALAVSKEIRDFARQDAKTMKDTLTGTAKYNEDSKVQMERKVFGTGDGILSKTIGNFIQTLSDFNSNALEGEDWFFLKGHYRRALGGWIQANGYTVDEVQSNPDLLEKGRQYAIEEAQKATYRDFNEMAKRLNDATRDAKTVWGKSLAFGVNAVLPFKKTPANILRRGLEYSPLGIAKSLTTDAFHLHQYNEYQKGNLEVLPDTAISPNQFIDKLCSGLTGSAIMAIGFLLAGSGAVTCGLDDDDDEFEKLKGGQEYSVNLGKLGNMVTEGLFKAKLFGEDVTFTIDWAAPMSMPFFVGAALREQVDGEGVTDIDGVLNAIFSIGEPLTNLSMLDGLNSVFRTSQNSDALPQVGAKIVSNYITSFIPSAVGAVARSFDPIRRKSFVESGKGNGPVGVIRSGIEQSKNKIPGVSMNSIPVRDAFGNIEETGTIERILENFALPGYLNSYKNDPVIDELERLYGMVDESKKSGMVPKMPQKTIGNGKVVLSAEQYDQLTEERGKTAHALIEQLMSNRYYQQVSDDDKATMINDVWTYATQNANYSISKDAKVDTWVLNSRANPIQGIVNRQKTRVDTEYKEGYKAAAVESVKNQNWDDLDVCIEKLEEAGVKDPEGSIKTAVGNAFKAQYIRAYQEGDSITMDEIETLLIDSGLGFDSVNKKGQSTFDIWIENMNDQVFSEEEPETGNTGSVRQPARYIASAGMSDSSFSNRTASMPERPASDNGWDQYMNDLDDYWADYDFASNDPVGQYGQGNIDLDNRQTVQNDDGSISTEQSFSFYDEQTGKEILIPLVADGRVMTQNEAIDRYYETGEYLGMFDDWHDADEYATMLHNRQDWYYHQ